MGFLTSFDYEKYLSGLVLLLIGVLIVGGGRIGIQVTSESEIRWIEAFGRIDAWVGWVIFWIALDSIIFDGKATTFILSKTVVPVVRAILSNILGEERLNALAKRLEKKKKKVRDIPLTLTVVRDLAKESDSQVVMTKQAYERTVGSVFDYAKQCGVGVVVEEE